MPESGRRRPAGWVRLLNLAFLVIGIGALVWMVRDVGVGRMVDLVMSVRWWVAAILATSLIEAALKARAVHVFMRPEQRMVGYPRVLAAQLAGQAINAVTPGGVGGEIAKATMLIGHAPRYRAVSSVITYNLVSTLMSAVMLLVAIAMVLVYDHPPAPVARALELTFAFVAGAGLLFLWIAQRGAVHTFTQLLRGVRAISAERRARIADRLRAFDDQVTLFRRGKAGSYRIGIVHVALARAVGWADLWVIMLALGEARGFVFTVIAAGAGMVVGSLASFVPLGLGVSEGGQAGVFELLGAGAEIGLAIGLIRRARSLVMAALGLLVMLAVELYDQISLARSMAAVKSRRAG